MLRHFAACSGRERTADPARRERDTDPAKSAILSTMIRRVFLEHAVRGVGSALLLPWLGLEHEAEANRKTFCGMDKKRKANVCTVRLLGTVPFFKARSADAGQCWLACLQMAAKFQGFDVPAPALLKELYEGKLPKTP